MKHTPINPTISRLRREALFDGPSKFNKTGTPSGTRLETGDTTAVKKKRRKIDRRPWTPVEDARIKKLVDEHGFSCWSKVAKLMSDNATPAQVRSGKQCRER